MIGNIAEKLLDALSMFWQALDFAERRVVLVVGVYLAAVAVGIAYRIVVAMMARDVALTARAMQDTPEPA